MIDPLPRHSCVAVFGLGASGIAAAHLLASFGKTIIASDTADESRRQDFLSRLPEGTQLVLGHNEIGEATAIVTSPGLEPSSPIFKEAEARNIPVIAELEVAFRAAEIPMVAITGTDGKTTTTTLTSHILNTCGVPNHMGGNVGIPLANVVKEERNDDCYVVETSAFQLVFCPSFKPHVLIATNIAEDHSEYFHGNWSQYVETKRKPLSTMTSHDIVILNATDPEMRTWDRYTEARKAWYAMDRADIPHDAIDFAYIENDAIMFHFNDEVRCLPLESLKLKGAHNAQNTMGAILAALFMGCEFDKIVASIDSYQLPPHRIQHVRTLHGVDFIDDSKATNPHAAIAALIAIDKPTVLIVGGLDKGLSLTDWIDKMNKNVRHVMVIGALSERFTKEALQNATPRPLHPCKTLEEAVVEGYKLALEDHCEVVMLSPGCSSYDMFKSYGQRGDVFTKAARDIEE